MCWQDYQIGRQTYSSIRAVTVSTTPTEICSGNRNRVCIILSPDQNQDYRILDTQAVSETVGFIISAAADPFKLTLVEDGDIVRHPIYGCATASTIQIGVIETYLDGEGPK